MATNSMRRELGIVRGVFCGAAERTNPPLLRPASSLTDHPMSAPPFGAPGGFDRAAGRGPPRYF